MIIRSWYRGPVVSVAPQMLLPEIEKLLGFERLGAVPVEDPTGKILGIVDWRGVRAWMARRPILPRPPTAKEVMTKAPPLVDPGLRMREAAAVMAREGVDHLLVGEHGRVLGILSSSDCLRYFAAREEGRRAALERGPHAG